LSPIVCHPVPGSFPPFVVGSLFPSVISGGPLYPASCVWPRGFPFFFFYVRATPASPLFKNFFLTSGSLDPPVRWQLGGGFFHDSFAIGGSSHPNQVPCSCVPSCLFFFFGRRLHVHLHFMPGFVRWFPHGLSHDSYVTILSLPLFISDSPVKTGTSFENHSGSKTYL